MSAGMGDPKLHWTLQGRRAVWEVSKRAALSVLFSSILLIPRIGRLRRRVWIWTAIRLGAILAGIGSAWQFFHLRQGGGLLVLGLALAAFGLLVGARGEEKSVDAQARELEALVSLNGGTYIPAHNGDPNPRVRIFVSPRQLDVLDSRHRRLVAIPLARVKQLEVRPLSAVPTARNANAPWQMEISWEAGEIQKSAFRFEGFFAEHLARIAETTIRGLLRKDLPVLRT